MDVFDIAIQDESLVRSQMDSKNVSLETGRVDPSEPASNLAELCSNNVESKHFKW